MRPSEVVVLHRPIPAVEIVEIEPDSPFNRTSLRPGDIIYRIVILSPRGISISKEQVFWVRNSSDFFTALNSVDINSSINIDSFRFRTATSRKENISDWGIKVKDVTIR